MTDAMPTLADPNNLVDGSSRDALVLRRVSNELNSELTPGLIHEVNNVLTGIYFNLEACQEVVGEDGAEAFQEISRGVERIKEVLARTSQIHLNVAERETTYHDLEALMASELDLLRVIFPKTAKIQFLPPESPIHVYVAEFPFRVALLSIASRLRPFLPAGRTEIPISVLTASQLHEVAARHDKEVAVGSVAVSFKIPCAIDSVTEMDSYPTGSGFSDISLANAETILAGIGGGLLFWSDPSGDQSEALLVLPCCDLN
jgi:signal transduction histidine kinase